MCRPGRVLPSESQELRVLGGVGHRAQGFRVSGSSKKEVKRILWTETERKQIQGTESNRK